MTKKADTAKPEIGQVWLAWDSIDFEGSPDHSGPRSLVTVVGPTQRQFGVEWVPVAGTDERVDAASAADACFETSESDLGHALRVRTDFMALVERAGLSELVGTIDEDLAALLAEAKLPPGRFGHPLGKDDWRLAEDRDYWRRWWDRRSKYDNLLMAAEDAADQCWRSAARTRWQEAIFGGKGGAWRASLAALPAPGTEIPSPEVLLSAAAGNAGSADRPAFWPVDLEALLDVKIEEESNTRVRVTGLPASMDGLTPVAASPALLSLFAAAWLTSAHEVHEVEGAGAHEVVHAYGLPEDMNLPPIPPQDLNDQTAEEWADGDFGLIEADSPIQGGETTFTLPRSIGPMSLDANWWTGLELLPPR